MRQRCGVALLALTWTVFPLAPVTAEPPAKPLVGADVVFEETGGVVAVEAEHFFRQTLTNKRAWYLTTKDRTPKVTPDGDEPHVAGASGGAYLELLPDTRRTHGDKLVSGENFCNTPGKMAVLHYKVHFNTPGKYYVWARIQSTGSEDNGLHVGLDGTWPESGQRMQWIAKRRWAWGSKQRTAKKHTGEPGKLFLQMREDGIEFDEWMMIDRRVQDVRGAGPPSKLKSGKLPKAFAAVQAPPASAAPPAAAAPKPTARPAAALPKGSVVARAEDFNVEGTNYYLDRGKWLAIDPAKHKSAEVKHRLAIPAGEYHVLLAAVGESDGQSKYEVLLDGKAVGTFTCPRASAMYAEGPNYAKVWPKVAVAKDATLTVRSQVGSADGVEHSRARVALVALVPVAGAKSPEALLASAGTPESLPRRASLQAGRRARAAPRPSATSSRP